MNILKRYFVFACLTIPSIFNLACRHCEDRYSPLEYYNHFVEADYHSNEPKKFDKGLAKNYCFKISHDCKSDLSDYDIIIEINDIVIYNGPL